MVRQLCIIIVLTVIVVICIPAYAAKIDVHADRNPVQVDESFTLVFSSTESVDGDPDFSPLEKDFRVLSRSQSSNFQFINGSLSRNSTWTLSVIAKNVGRIKIPKIEFGDDSSRPLAITVTQGTAQKGGVKSGVMFLEVEVDKKNVYVQSQLLFTLRIFLAVQHLKYDLSELVISDKDAIVEQLGNNPSFTKEINNRTYRVFEIQYAIFPQNPGALTIEPIKFEMQYVDNRRAMRHKVLESDVINIDVKAIPNQAKNTAWLPAKSVRISEKWSTGKPKFTVGEAVTRTITVIAKGQMSSTLTPMNTKDLSFAKLYPDQPVLDDEKSSSGIIGKRAEKLAIIPHQNGSYKLPAIEIPWWNTETNKLEVARLKSRNIQITGATSAPVSPKNNPILPKPSDAIVQPSVDDSSTNNSLNTDKNSIGSTTESIWFWLSLLFLFLWLQSISFWWLNKRKQNKKNETSTQRELSRREIEKKLKSACTNNDANLTKTLLLEWAFTIWDYKVPRNLGTLAKQCGSALGNEISYLNKLLYGNNDKNWNGENLILELRKFTKNNNADQPVDKLEPMYYHVT